MANSAIMRASNISAPMQRANAPGLYAREGSAAMSKIITLNHGYQAIVDDDVFETINKHRWLINGRQTKPYASRVSGSRGNKKKYFMHRVIIGATPGDGVVVDHINGNTLDNRRSNLRVCCHKDNMKNQAGRKKSTSIFKGVSRDEKNKKWVVQVMLNGRRVFHARAIDEIEAALAHDVIATRVHGEHAWLNFPRRIVEALDEALS